MLAHTPRPDESTLRAFLLGRLAPEKAEEVAAWLASEPPPTDSLRRLAAGDPRLGGLADTPPDEAVPAPAGGGARRPLVRGPRGRVAPRAPQSADPLPTQLGSYRVVREIGRGGMGVVLEAYDEQLRRRVAVKVMAPHLLKRPDAKARFLREARAAAAIDHENVVPIYH